MLTKQTLCANLNTYIFCLILLIAAGWALSLAETMSQCRKSEFLHFLCIWSSGVGLLDGSSDLEMCYCRGSAHRPLGASLGILLAHSAGAGASMDPSAFLTWGIFTSPGTRFFYWKLCYVGRLRAILYCCFLEILWFGRRMPQKNF